MHREAPPGKLIPIYQLKSEEKAPIRISSAHRLLGSRITFAPNENPGFTSGLDGRQRLNDCSLKRISLGHVKAEEENVSL